MRAPRSGHGFPVAGGPRSPSRPRVAQERPARPEPTSSSSVSTNARTVRAGRRAQAAAAARRASSASSSSPRTLVCALPRSARMGKTRRSAESHSCPDRFSESASAHWRPTPVPAASWPTCRSLIGTRRRRPAVAGARSRCRQRRGQYRSPQQRWPPSSAGKEHWAGRLRRDRGWPEAGRRPAAIEGSPGRHGPGTRVGPDISSVQPESAPAVHAHRYVFLLTLVSMGACWSVRRNHLPSIL